MQVQKKDIKLPDWYLRRKHPLYGRFKKYFSGHWVTNFLIAITIIVYLIEFFLSGSFNISGRVLEVMGGRWNPDLMAGEWWRLFTPIFLHVTIYHIAFNMVALYYAGPLVEEVYGHFKFLLIYLFTGFTGNLLSALFSQNSISAGASTSLFGLFAVLALMQIVRGFRHQFAEISHSATTLIIANLIFNLFMPGVDIAGHIGGLLGGAISVLLWTPADVRKHYVHDGLGTAAALVVVVGVCLWLTGVIYY
ncbi:MAG: rhomboid family intramembrane serine protease [Liquorilactobacillus nagelii]|uniref:rhomboid family intramembrane serine protease n=2 Tax=Liquorilactobacillus nagelii TaxID=82688 RepID=UPI0011D17844|nr:rhomboid family intramembrane serine protease [Liquorilactobacillus nagelii]MCC7615743.1 rhomboid family intramembrane serine protease [Liquorilactobacillus nagelii]MCP9314049.1 rhomboid family intramembrane serine protease [Liquorilactobacillus nagelii]